MQTLKEKLKEDLKVALKTGNYVKKDLIKVILSEISIEEGRGAANFFLNDEGILSVIKKIKKNQEELLEKSKNIGRSETEIEAIEKEIKILNLYLPVQMTEEEIELAVEHIIESLGASSMKEMGLVMNKFSTDYPGLADGKIVSKYVKSKLSA